MPSRAGLPLLLLASRACGVATSSYESVQRAVLEGIAAFRVGSNGAAASGLYSDAMDTSGRSDHLSSAADGTPPFDFVAPSSSTEHLSSYIGKGVYYRVVDEE